MPTLLEAPTEQNPFSDLIPKDIIGGENGAPAQQIAGGQFSAAPKAEINMPTDYGSFADLVPDPMKTGGRVAGADDYGVFSDLVPKSPASETEKAAFELSDFDKKFLSAEKFVSETTGIPFHESMNALRSLSAGAGKYIFEGLQGFELNRAKILANPPRELTQPQGDDLILPDGSMMSKEQQDALEQRYHDAAIAQIPDAKAKADYFKQVAENANASQYVDPELAQTVPARIAHAAGSAGVMALESMIPGAGVPFMVTHGALATEAEAKNAGKTDAEAEAAGVRSAIGLALFGGASKFAALGIAKLLPDGASSVRTFLTQFVGQEAANETSSRAINAWEKAADAPEGKKIEAALNALKDTTLEQSTLNAVYALAHASKAAEKPPVRPEAAPEPSAPLQTAEIPPAMAGEPGGSEDVWRKALVEEWQRLIKRVRDGSANSIIVQRINKINQELVNGPGTEPIEQAPMAEVLNQPDPGMVRLYHGAAKEAGQAGTDFTPNRDYAQGYADKSNGQVWYVDVPKDSPFLARDEGNAIPGQEAPLINGQKLPNEIADQAKPLGEQNALQIGSTETQIPRTTETGQDQPGSSEGVGRSEQGTETAGTPQAQEPIGVADAIAEIQRRNAPAPPLGEHGVSRAARESAGEVDVTSAGHNSAEAHVERGNKLISSGVIPDEIVQDAITRNAWSSDAVDAAIAKDADLTEKARSARRAADADPSQEAAATEAEKAAQTWEDTAIRPIRGQFHETGMALQSARNLDTGDYIDYSKTFVDKNGRAPDAKEETVLQKATRKIRDLNAADARELNQLDRTGGRPRKSLDPKRLREELAALKEKMLADCLL